MLINTFAILISVLSFLIIFRNLMKDKLKHFFVLFLAIFVITIFNTSNLPSLTQFGIIIVFTIYQFIVVKEQLLKSVIISFLTCNIFLLSDFIVGFMFMNIFKVSFEYIRNNPVTIILIHIALFVTTFIISSILRKILLINSEIFVKENYSKVLLSVLFINITSVFWVMYFFVISMRKYIPNNNITMIITIISGIYFVSSFVAIFCYGMYIKKDIELIQKKSETKQLQEYTDRIELLYSDMRKFKHDYVNLLSTINGYIEIGEIEELKRYFSEKLIPMSNEVGKDDIRLSSLYNLKNIPLKGLLSSKLQQAQNKKMDILIDISEKVHIQEECIAVIDLCRVMGILVDNAIEAAYESEKKFIRIGLVNRENSVIIIVLNSIESNITTINTMFKKGFSTKGNNRGLGLYNVNEIIRKYNNITINTFVEGLIFTQELTITK